MAIEAGNDQLLEIDGFPTPDGQSNLVPAYQAVSRRGRERGDPALADRGVGAPDPRPEVGRRPRRATRSSPRPRSNDLVGTSAHLNVARKTAKRSITLLKNRDNTLPLSEFSKTRVLSTGWGATSTGLIANEIASRDLTAQPLATGSNPDAQKIAQVKRAARQFDAVVVNTNNVWAPGSLGQRQLVRELPRRACR